MRTLSMILLLIVAPLTWGSAVTGPGGLALAVPFNGGLLAIPWGWNELQAFSGDGEAIQLPLDLDGVRPISAPAVFDDMAAIAFRTGEPEYIATFTLEGTHCEYGPYSDCGAPAFDGTGRLWFTADGSLFVSGQRTPNTVDAHTICPDSSGLAMVYCDEEDRLRILDTVTGTDRVIHSQHRCYAPVFIVFGEGRKILSPTLEGSIIMVSPSDGSWRELARGSHPFWWADEELVLYSVTEDDGHNITSAEIWGVAPGGAPRPLSSTEDLDEIQPFVFRGCVMAIDAGSGSIVRVGGP